MLSRPLLLLRTLSEEFFLFSLKTSSVILTATAVLEQSLLLLHVGDEHV